MEIEIQATCKQVFLPEYRLLRASLIGKPKVLGGWAHTGPSNLRWGIYLLKWLKEVLRVENHSEYAAFLLSFSLQKRFNKSINSNIKEGDFKDYTFHFQLTSDLN